ncbi:NAD(P)/FAD-dependent oxidoreductase [Bacillus thermotolerans]|uniref:Thioredoxin reductase n=1 Tax=Bacillus thermotolerans TaxID=1221996 RepID=A0A0F5IAK7_BACTR|nr:NAD(P)/FAD-dependent oxidoreductase [Bacillus thermotolerans]KKB38838.1 Thioredoxin reductase [Bacillus thermotolerans]KKB42493.1 Thioredoxin reductase [Bacillus thermotolerans]KKB44559.1 Thioredoxin reductase [Bacillus thermotolerans]
MNSQTRNIQDVAIIGGGPGGLSAALVLGRALRKVTVIDEGKPRSRVTVKAHGFLTRDGVHPSEIREVAHEQMKAYENVQVVKDTVEIAEKIDGLFSLRTRKGEEFLSRRLIVATGMKDHLPKITGMEKVYGKTVFHCPYCDGWERKGEPLAIFGNGKGLMPFIKTIYNWSRDLIVFTNGPAALIDEEKRQLKQRGIDVMEEPILAIESTNGQMEQILLKDRGPVKRTSGFMVTTGETQASAIPSMLGVPLDERGQYETREHGQTSINGLFIIGDAKNTFTSIVGAASQGYEAGVALNHDLAAQDWENEKPV